MQLDPISLCDNISPQRTNRAGGPTFEEGSNFRAAKHSFAVLRKGEDLVPDSRRVALVEFGPAGIGRGGGDRI